MDPAVAATSASAAVSAQTAQDAMYYWMLFKHQLKLSTGLLAASYHRGANLLLAPNALVHSLSTLIPGKEAAPRVELAKRLFFTKCNRKMDANIAVGYYGTGNKANLKHNVNELHVGSFHYVHPCQQMKPKLCKKLWKRYRTTVKELKFISNEKPNVQALQTINADAQAVSPCPSSSTPIMSTLEYVNHIDASLQTVLSNVVHFDGLWSKTFEVQYGEFRKSNGEAVKTPLLVKNKSYFYYHDEVSMAQAIKINCSHGGNLALVLLLPVENISLEHYIHSMLSYDRLKRIFKKLTTRADVHLTFPKFRLTSTRHIARPMQSLGFEDILQLNKNSSGKKPTKYVPPLDDHVLLLQQSTIDVQERGVDD